MLVAITHIVIDFITVVIANHRPTRARLWPLVLDQVLHTLAILWLWQALSPSLDPRIVSFYASMVSPVTVETFASLAPQAGTFSANKLLIVLNSYVAAMFGGAVLVKKILDTISVKPLGEDEHDRSVQMGKYIGILERGVVLTLAISGALPSVAFVLTAKSIARFDKLSEDRQFAEYYLIGTLTSTLIAIVIGLIAAPALR